MPSRISPISEHAWPKVFESSLHHFRSTPKDPRRGLQHHGRVHRRQHAGLNLGVRSPSRRERVPNPDSFDPERWLGDAGKKLQSSFITYSAGARGCIGKNITYLEQTALVASLFHNYELA